MSLRRIVAIEFGMCRSGRNGGSSGSVTVGYGSLREQPGATKSRGGNRLPFGDQEPVGRDAQCGMMMKAWPSSPFKMAQANFLLEFLIVALDAPAYFGGVDQIAERNAFWQGRQPILGRCILVLRPLDHQPLFCRLLSPFMAGCNVNPHARKPRAEPFIRAFPPLHRMPRFRTQPEGTSSLTETVSGASRRPFVGARPGRLPGAHTRICGWIPT